MLPELEALVAGSRDAVGRVIADLRAKAAESEQLRAAEHRAFMAEQREGLAAITRAAAEKLAAVRDGKDPDPWQPDWEKIGDLIEAAVQSRMAAIEPPKDGASVTVDDVRPLIETVIAEAVAALPPAQPGKDAEPFSPDMEELGAVIDGLVTQRMASFEPPNDGASVTVDDVRPLIETAIAEAVAALPPAQPGKDAEPYSPDMDELGAVIDGFVAQRMAMIEPPKDGASVTLDDVRPLIEEQVAKAVAAIPTPNDGVGLADALIDRTGSLVVTMTNGSTRNLGLVVGQDADPALLAQKVREAVDAIPRPEDGKDADPEQIALIVAEAIAALPSAPAGKDAYPGEARGLYDAGAIYRALDVVSFNGSEWRAKRDEPGELPGDGWMLSASRGKAGKPGKDGAAIVAAFVDAKALDLTLTRDDGIEVKADLYELARVIRD